MEATKAPPPRKTLTLYFANSDRARLDSLAAAGGLSRSAVVRRLLDLAEGATPSTIQLRRAVAR